MFKSQAEIPPSEFIHKVQEEQYRQRLAAPIYTANLPCFEQCRTTVQIMSPEDQIVMCPTCGKKYLLTYSSIGNSQFEYEDPRTDTPRYH